MKVGDLVDAGYAEIKTGPFGTQLRASDYVDEGRAVLNVRNVGFGDVRPKDLEYVNEETAQRLSTHLLKVNDIVFGRKGAVERHAFINDKYDGAMQGSDCIRLRVSEDSPVPARFITFALRTPEHQKWMQAFCSHGATMASLNQAIVRQIPLPDLDSAHQELAVAVLQSIDNLIENNRRRVEVLEAVSRAIYREWFVKFRYPGHEDVPLIDSTLGRIPDGWQLASLAGIAHITMGQSPKSEFYNFDAIGKPFHQGVADFGTHFPSTRKWCSVEGRSASDGDVLVSVRAPVGRINVADTDITIGRGLAALRAKDGRQGLLLGQLREVFAEEDSMGNDGAIYKSLGKTEFGAIRVLVPPGSIADAADEVLTQNLAMIRAMSGSVRRLSALRDLLLPKLATGQIDVSTLHLDALVSTSSTTGVEVT
jgi:type I restriction enzyme S subunit